MQFLTTLVTLASMATAMASASPGFSPVPETGLATRTNKSFNCPNGMSYCPWTKACSCEPGMEWNDKKSCCVGTKIKGAWPEPNLDVYASVKVELGTFCAASPTKIVKYNSKHAYCQASLNTVTFCAPKTIEKELLSIGVGIDINLKAGISADLKNTCAGLSGLYLESVFDAVALFNSNKFGLGLAVGGGIGGLLGGVFKTIKNVTCLFGLGGCSYDCVSYCTKGCGNYVDVVGTIGGTIKGFVGFCILPDVIIMINGVGKLVTSTIEGLLCIVGNILTAVLSSFDCNCH